jgi:glycosyltransferase involved in cell wall biosynthesis
MRVLHITSTYLPDSYGGIETVVRQICLNTKIHGVENRIMTLSVNPFPQVNIVDGVEVFRAQQNFVIQSNRFSLSAFSIFRDLVEWADIVHYHFPWPFADLLHVFCKVNKKSIVTYHSDIVRQKKLSLLYSPLMNTFLKSINKIVSTSPNYFQSSSVLKKYKDKVEVIPIGISENSYPTPLDSELSSVQNIVGKDFFLFIGMFREYKGLKYLIEAIQQIPEQFIIAGSGKLEVKLKRLANNLGLTNVHFIGRVSDIEKVALFKLCKAIVFPSIRRSEAFGVTLVEGAMYGKPLVSTEIGTGTSYINLNEKTGIVIPPKDTKALKSAIMRISSDLSLSKKMGYSSRLRYEELFSGEKMGKKYFNIYKAL